MALADIFNSTFFLVLGIVLLLFGLLVMYFETKMRDQNHKISSMVSLVSAMAEEVKGIRMRHGLSVNPLNNIYPFGSMNSMNSMNTLNSDTLIAVSDGEEEDDDDETDDGDHEDYEDDETNDGEDEDDDDQENNSQKTNFKNILLNESSIINIGDENMKIFNFKKEELDLEEEELDDLDEDNLDDEKELNEIIHNSSELEDLSEIELNHSFININEQKGNMDFLKTINISNLEDDENQNSNNDIKKLSLNKLRNIVVEKGIVTDPSKMKKPELLKLLGVE
jgi:hypothetical protein